MFLLPNDKDARLLLASLPLLVVLVYAVAFPGHFFMDDIQVVLQNNFTYNWDIKGIFTSDYWGAGGNTGLYRPLTILSFAVNATLFGPEIWGYYLVNVLLHAVVSCLLFLYLRQLEVPLRASWLAAAIFAVHPIHAEPVIELVGRSELLVGIFGLLALLCARSGWGHATLGVAAAYLAAILSKEHGVVLVGILPLVDLYVDRVGFRELLRRRGRLLTALVAITLLWLLYRKFVVHAGLEPPISFDPYYIPLMTVDGPTRLLSALKLQLLYLRNLFTPYQLQGMYPASVVTPFISWFSWWAVGILAVIGVSVGLAWQGWTRRQWWGLAIVLYVVSFSPTANVIFPTGFTMADRVAYFPSLWFCLGLAAGISFLLDRVDGYRLRQVFCALVILGYGATGILRAADFRSVEGFWKNDLRINPRNELSPLMLVDHYRTEGRGEEALAILAELTRRAPDFEKALSTYAGVLVEAKRYDEAIAVAKRAIELETTMNCVSSARLPLASAYLELGRPEEALNVLQTISVADRLRPLYWELRGKAYEAKGDYLTALAHYQRELANSGERSADGFRRTGKVLLQIGNLDQAEKMLRRDVEINPESAEGWNLLGVALAGRNLFKEAQEAFQQAVTLKPDSAEYRANLDRSRGK